MPSIVKSMWFAYSALEEESSERPDGKQRRSDCRAGKVGHSGAFRLTVCLRCLLDKLTDHLPPIVHSRPLSRAKYTAPHPPTVLLAR